MFAAKDNDKGKEAKALVEAVNKYVETKKASLEKGAETSPAKTLLDLETFYIQVRGLSCENEVKQEILKLKKDKYVMLLLKIMKKVDSTQAKVAKRGKSSKSDTKLFAKAKAALQKIIDGGKASEAVAGEAKEYMQTF